MYRMSSSTHKDLGSSIQKLLRPLYEMPDVSGVPYARYLEWRDDDCDFQAGILLRNRVPQTETACVDLYAACTAVHIEYRGTYEGLSQAHRVCREYLKAHGLTQGGPAWEVFDGPPDESGIAKVLVYWPVQLSLRADLLETTDHP